MRVALKVGGTVYPLAGQAGVSERDHSSASEFRLTAESQTQLLERVRAATAPTVDRGNLKTSVSFTTFRLFANPAAAFLFVLDHDAAIPREGIVQFEVEGPAGTSLRHLTGAVVNPPSRRCIGCTALLEYTATGAGFVIPAQPPVTSLSISGVTPALPGPIYVVPAPETSAYGGGGPEWSSSADLTVPGSGIWAKLYRWLLITPASATLAAIAPPANYYATGSQSTASQIQRWTGSAWVIYWLYNGGDSDPATAYWVDAADGGLANQNDLVIASSSLVTALNRVAGQSPGAWQGGLGTTWTDSTSTTYRHYLIVYSAGSIVGVYISDSTTPKTGTWTKTSGSATGTPVIT